VAARPATTELSGAPAADRTPDCRPPPNADIKCPLTCDGRGHLLGLAGSEHDRSALVHEHAVVEIAPDRACEDDALEVTADPFEVLDRVPVTYPLDVLLDDRARVELVGGVVRRRAMSLTPRWYARRYGWAPANAGRKE
jgi:hypothetical protein